MAPLWVQNADEALDDWSVPVELLLRKVQALSQPEPVFA